MVPGSGFQKDLDRFQLGLDNNPWLLIFDSGDESNQTNKYFEKFENLTINSQVYAAALTNKCHLYQTFFRM